MRWFQHIPLSVEHFSISRFLYLNKYVHCIHNRQRNFILYEWNELLVLLASVYTIFCQFRFFFGSFSYLKKKNRQLISTVHILLSETKLPLAENEPDDR